MRFSGVMHLRLGRVLATNTFCLLVYFVACNPAGAQQPNSFRVLHIMSYHTPWKWTDDQFRGFRDGLAGLDVEYKVFEMDTKRNSSAEWKKRKGTEARELIDQWKPDLVYLNDDNAQEYVTRYYIDSSIPFVFSGVNEEPEVYGFVGSRNITGVLEHEHSLQTLRLLRTLDPTIKTIAVIVDDGPTWPKVIARMRERITRVPDLDLEVVSWDVIRTFQEYKDKVTEYQDSVDAIGTLGIFTYKDDEGNNVPYSEVLRWTVEHSRLPDFSFWADRVDYGTLCVVGVSGFAQGKEAGEIARRILVDGVSPSAIPMQPTMVGEPLVSLARLRKLGLQTRSTPLLSSRVIETFSWDR